MRLLIGLSLANVMQMGKPLPSKYHALRFMLIIGLPRENGAAHFYISFL